MGEVVLWVVLLFDDPVLVGSHFLAVSEPQVGVRLLQVVSQEGLTL